jgi:hypothetical protein
MRRKHSSVAGWIVISAAHQNNAQLFDTGWTFVRTAQTPPPGPPVGGH